MENKNKKKAGGRGSTTSSNIAVELFGPKDSSSPPSSGSLFASLFPHPSTGGGRSSSGTTGSWKQQDLGDAQYPRPDEISHEEGNIYQNVASDSSNYFSSSIHYGGRETYSPRTQSTHSHTPYKKDGEEDDPDDKASRGNWWQGSLYY